MWSTTSPAPPSISKGIPQDSQGHAQLFFSLYFAMTGLHALHMVIGAGMLLSLILEARKGTYTSDVL